MTTTQVVETSVTVSSSPILDFVHPADGHAQPTYTYCLIVLNNVWGAKVTLPSFHFNKSVIIDLNKSC